MTWTHRDDKTVVGMAVRWRTSVLTSPTRPSPRQNADEAPVSDREEEGDISAPRTPQRSTVALPGPLSGVRRSPHLAAPVVSPQTSSGNCRKECYLASSDEDELTATTSKRRRVADF
jgi:hypothetical protein